MGLHILPVAKLGLISYSSAASVAAVTNPVLSSLLCPFVLKLSLNIGIVRAVCTDLFHSSRVFLFQLAQIAFDSQPSSDGDAADVTRRSRWQRALRLVCESLTHAGRLASEDRTLVGGDDSSFRFAVTLLSL